MYFYESKGKHTHILVCQGGKHGLLFMSVAAVRNKEQTIFPYLKGTVWR